jgi:hypothetical protein
METWQCHIRFFNNEPERKKRQLLHLLNALKEKGYDIIVHNPSNRMALICDRFDMELMQHKGEEYMFYNNKIKK